MQDQYQRTIDYVRISVTDRCNLRCRYCMPREGLPFLEREELLTFEEILRFCRIAADLGIKKVKITGGEPLVRKGICDLVHNMRGIPGIESVTLTTNGILLSTCLPQLKAAGLSGVNISLDTLEREIFLRITRRDALPEALEGIRLAIDSGIPTKINCVAMRGVNETELTKIAAIAREREAAVRFIEMMPVGEGVLMPGLLQEEVEALLEQAYGKLTPVTETGNGPASYYTLAGFRGKIGFISAMSHKFCTGCNRIRLTADGILKSCLQYESQLDIRRALRKGAADGEIKELIRKGISEKPMCHTFEEKDRDGKREKRRMAQIGG